MNSLPAGRGSGRGGSKVGLGGTGYNFLMFGDGGWDESVAYEQELRQQKWFGRLAGAPLAIVECGAGKAIPTVRHFSEGIARQFGGRLIRINVREPEVPAGHVGLALGASQALRRIDELLAEMPPS